MAKYPHVKKFKNSHSRSRGKCITDRWTDRWTTDNWTDEQDWFYRTPNAKLEVQSCLSVIWEYNLEIINTRKRNTINIISCSTSSITKLGNINFILFECHRSIDKSIDFHFLLLLCLSQCLSVTVSFIATKSSVMEIQNLVGDPKSEPLMTNSKQYQFLFKYISSKNYWQNF